MIFKRKKYLDEIYSSLESEKLIIIYGARQVGKTTLLKILLDDKNIGPNKTYINFDDIYEKEFKSKLDFMKYLEFNYSVKFFEKGILFLDEVQTIENIEQILKSLYDDLDIKLQIIATGSGLWQIKKLGSSLVGRVKQIWVYPFSFFEFLEFKSINIDFLSHEKYENFMFEKIESLLKEYYIFGGYPAVVTKKTKKEKILKISEIIDLYLKKDITLFLSSKEIINFRKMFIFLANNISSSLNITTLSNYLGVSRNKTEYYIEILEKSFLLHKIYPFYSNPRKEYSKQPEVFLNDFGIINYFKNNFTFLDFDGNIVENFVYLELLKNKNIFSDEIKTYNKINGSEIDFIYEFKKGGIIPIEVKLNNRDTIPKIFNGFGENYGNNINYFIKTSTSVIGKREIPTDNNIFILKIFPFWMISKILD